MTSLPPLVGGGQGRSPREVRDSAQATGAIFALAAILVLILAFCRRCYS